MAKKDSKKKKPVKKPKVNPDLDGFDIEIDSFGEIRSNFNIDKINDFLNKNVEDKKLVDRKDYDKLKKGQSDEEE